MSEREDAKRYLSRMEWEMDEESFQVLDKPVLTWIARVTTTHLLKQGRPEQRFYVLVSRSNHVILEEHVLPVLVAWFQVQKEKESETS